MRPTPATLALLLFLAPAAFAQDAATPATDPNAPITLAQAMADPDWIGPPVEQAWWSWDGQRAYYQLKRDGATIRDTWRAADRRRRGRAARRRRARRRSMPRNPVYDAQRTRMAFVRNGDVFVRDLRSGALHPGHAQQRRRSAAAVEQRRRPGRGASATTGTAGPRADGVRQAALRQGREGSGRARRRPTTCATGSCA